MKKIIASILLFYISTNLLAQQNNQYQNDIDFLYKTLKETPGYKAQITGEKRIAYQKLYEKLRTKPVNPSALDTFYNLTQLIWPIKDKHLGFYQTWDQKVDFKMLKDPEFIKRYRASSAFKNFPRVNINLDSLEAALVQKPADSVEGIYYVGDIGKIGIYRTSKQDSLIGIILSSQLQTSEPGQLFAILWQTGQNSFRTIYNDLITKSFCIASNAKLTHGRFHHYDLHKQNSLSFAEFWSNEPYLFKALRPDLQYIYLGRFRSSNENLKIATTFYNKVKDSLNAPNLIVDLRGNPGGGDRCSDQFFSLIKRYSKTGKVYVLINSFVMSNAEQFTIKLKALKNVKVFGETTDGMITYGRESGEVPTLPSGRFKIYNSDMKDMGNFLQYEEIGITPDVFLNLKTDWIEQLKILIDVT